MIAARTSRTGTLGFVGGMDIPLIRRFAKGYEEGARSVNPEHPRRRELRRRDRRGVEQPGQGQGAGRWRRSARGADVIFAAAGNSGLGVFDAVEQDGTENGRARALRHRRRLEPERRQAGLRADEHGQARR